MNSHKITFLKLAFVLFVCGVLFGIVFQNDLRRPKVKHANIPAAVHTAISAYNEHSDFHYVKDVQFGPRNWSNEKDFGEKNDWEKEEKGDFIVYYQKDKSGKWQKRTLDVIRDVDHIKQGLKPHPKKLNGHKFPIYLAPTDSEFIIVSTNLANDSVVDVVFNKDLNGLMVSEFGPLGYMARGCVIRPTSYELLFNEPGGIHDLVQSCLTTYAKWTYFDEIVSVVELIGSLSPEIGGLLESSGDIGKFFSQAVEKAPPTVNLNEDEKQNISGEDNFREEVAEEPSDPANLDSAGN